MARYSRLEDIYPDEWAEEYSRGAPGQLMEKEIEEILEIALKRQGFEDPQHLMFEYDGERGNFDVVLLEAPDMDMEAYKDKWIYNLKYNTVTVGFFTTIEGQSGTLFKCLVRENNKEQLKNFKPGEQHIAVGNYRKREVEDRTFHQLSPCMYLTTVEKAAEKLGLTEPEEEEEEFEEFEEMEGPEEEEEEAPFEEVEEEPEEEEPEEEEKDIVDEMFG